MLISRTLTDPHRKCRGFNPALTLSALCTGCPILGTGRQQTRGPERPTATALNVCVTYAIVTEGVTAPSDYGGLGLGYSEHAVAMEVRAVVT